MSAAVNTWPATKGVRFSRLSRAADLRVNTSMAKSAPQFCFCCTEVVVVWTERGGPSVVAPAGGAGFGTRLVKRSMADQLGGSIDHDWSEDGLIVKLRMNKDLLAR